MGCYVGPLCRLNFPMPQPATMQAKRNKINKILFKVRLVENFKGQWNTAWIALGTVTKILKYFKTTGCRKWKNGFKIEELVALAEYFEQQTDCSRYRRKLANQGEVLCTRGGISPIHLSLWSKWKPCHRTLNSWPRNLRTALEKYFRFHWNCKELWVEVRNSMSNCQIYFPIFSETIL